jgi:hypothetical protein
MEDLRQENFHMQVWVDGPSIGKVAEAGRVHTGICPRFEVAPMPKGRAAELMNLGQIPVWAR